MVKLKLWRDLRDARRFREDMRLSFENGILLIDTSNAFQIRHEMLQDFCGVGIHAAEGN
jgi:hypothetical protein